MTGSNKLIPMKANPNTIDFYLELHQLAKNIDRNIRQMKTNPIDENKTAKITIHDERRSTKNPNIENYR